MKRKASGSTKNFDKIMLGDEPKVPRPDDRAAMIHAYYWYRCMWEPAQIKQYVCRRLSELGMDDHAIALMKVKETEISPTLAANLRIEERGGEVDHQWRQEKLDEIFEAAVVNEITQPHNTSNSGQLSVAKQMIAVFDRKIEEQQSVDCYATLSAQQVSKNQISEIHKHYSLINDNIINFPKEFQENYRNLTRTQRNTIAGSIKTIVDDCELLMFNANKQRAVRKRKTTKTKAIKAVYCREFEPLKIVSIDINKVVGSTAIIVYNTVNRVISVIASSDKLTINRSTLTNVDETTSYSKKIRKPEEFFATWHTLSKSQHFKAVENIKSKKQKISTRINDKIVILESK